MESERGGSTVPANVETQIQRILGRATDGSWLGIESSPVFDLIPIPLLFINLFDDSINGSPVLRIRDVR
jgi:hypothetical protein